MKRFFAVALTLVLTTGLTLSTATAAKREKFGSDARHADAKRVKFKTSTEKIKWKMVMPWSKGLLFYDVAAHFADSVRLASAGRLDIKPFSAGELVPAMQSFDAVAKGSAQVGHDWPGYWKGKNEAFVAFASVPFGLDAEVITSGSKKKVVLSKCRIFMVSLDSTLFLVDSSVRKWVFSLTSAQPKWKTSKVCVFVPQVGSWIS